MTSLRVVCLLPLLLLITHSPARADSPAPIPALPWLHEGMLFTSTWLYARAPRNCREYRENPNGQWCDEFGRPLSDVDLHGTSAAGYAQTTISCIDGDKIATTTQSFADGRALGLADPLPLQGIISGITRLGSDPDHWVDPVQLAAVKSNASIGRLVAPVQWRGPNGMRDAIRVTLVNDDGYVDHIYDKKTGICIHFASSSKNAPSFQPLAPGAENQGPTILTRSDLLSVRTIKVPWSGEQIPPWVGQLRALHYRGRVVFRNSSIQVPNQTLMDFFPIDHGDGWLLAKMSFQVQYQNAPPIPPTQGQLAFGRTQFGALWAGPNALANLRPGDVLDRDPITKMQIAVAAADNQSVTLVQSNSAGEIASRYDKRSGILIDSSFYTSTTNQQWELHLAGRE